MDEKKFEEIMNGWGERELASAPKLQPTAEMLAAVKARKRPLLSPLFARWATVGAAAAAMLIATTMYPRWFQPKQAMQEEMSPVSSVEQPAMAAGKAQNEAVVARSVSEVADAENSPADENVADKGLAPPVPASAPELKAKAMAADQRESRPAPEEIAERKAESAPQSADSAAPALDVFIAPQKEKAAVPKICAVQPVGTSALQESEAMLSGNAAAPTSSFEGQASKLMSEAQRGMVAQCQRIGDKTFMLDEDVWVDSEHAPETMTIAIQRGSDAYRQALELRPELQPYFDAWERVIVNLGDVSLEISPQGKTTFSEDDIAQFSRQQF